MERTGVQRLAAVLKVLVTVTFVCNLIVLPMVPGIVGISAEGDGDIVGIYAALMDLPRPLVFLNICWFCLWRVWREAYMAVLTLFLLFCGGCTAVILWQGRRVLDSILKQDTFTFENARNMRRAAVCCLLISGAALLRTVWGLVYYATPAVLFTYNALFVPIFLMGGLLCLVMSALFRQAAELKAEHDLTI